MRRFLPRPGIPGPTQTKLQEKTDEILLIAEGDARKERATDIYNASRQTAWFAPIIEGLRGLCGLGELCMYCSSNEPSQVEHFQPIALFPEHALDYNNFLWSCSICNGTHKGDKFPPTNYPGAPILNPLDDDVWEYFFIDEHFGRLVRRVDPDTNQALPRAVSTCEVVGIDRENVQIKRSRRYKNLRRDVQSLLEQFIGGTKNSMELSQAIAELRSEPFQADVGDYFLNGPGRSQEPFRSLLLAAEEAVV